MSTEANGSRAKLEQLWVSLLESFIHYLATTPPEKRRASYAHVIASFLKDNNVSIDSIKKRSLDEATLQLRSKLELPFTQH